MITLYAFTSDDAEPLDTVFVDALGGNTGAPMELPIAEDALFLTLAVGANNDDITCDHGVFANPVISVVDDGGGGPQFVRGDSDANGGINLTDGIVTLSFLFLGGLAPGCMLAEPNPRSTMGRT